jgi:hypothetical protein
MLCKHVKFENIFDFRYDVLLSCGTDFVRSLSREQYTEHQRNCRQCELFCFNNIQSALQDTIDAFTKIGTDMTLLQFNITQSMRKIKDLQEHLSNTGTITRCAKHLQERIDSFDDYDVHNHDAMKVIAGNIDNYALALVNASRKIISEKIVLKMQERKDLLTYRKELERQIFDLSGNTICWMGEKMFSIEQVIWPVITHMKTKGCCVF